MRLEFIQSIKCGNKYNKTPLRYVTCPKCGLATKETKCQSCEWFGYYREEDRGIVCRWSQQSEILKEQGGKVW